MEKKFIEVGRRVRYAKKDVIQITIQNVSGWRKYLEEKGFDREKKEDECIKYDTNREKLYKIVKVQWGAFSAVKKNKLYESSYVIKNNRTVYLVTL